MIRLPEVVTVGGTATLVFELTNRKGKRLANVDGIVTVSLRKTSTRRSQHELTHLPATIDPASATVSLRLTVEQTMSLNPKPQQHIGVVGDVRIVNGVEVEYYGPFTFQIRMPETYEGQPTQPFNLMGGLSTDSTPETAELTIAQVGAQISFPKFTDRYLLIWRLDTEPDLISVVPASYPTHNQIGVFTLWPDLVTLSDGRQGKVLVSNQKLTLTDDIILELA